MSKSTKKLISQRWFEEFAEEVRKTASKMNITSTELTTESLKLMISLYKKYPDIMGNEEKRTEFLLNLVSLERLEKKTSSEEVHALTKESGFIIDRLSDYLKENQNQTFSTTELAEILNIPQPTVRTYIRNLSEANPRYKLIPGRPNFIGYFEN